MRQAKVLYKNEVAGNLIQHDDGSYQFSYTDDWFSRNDKPAISLTFPKAQQNYTSTHLFPFFYNMLPEGVNKQSVCFFNRIDTTDFFSLLIATATHDTIGAVTIKKNKK